MRVMERHELADPRILSAIEDAAVMSACPACDFGRPRALCPYCYGTGTVDLITLARYEKEQNQR